MFKVQATLRGSVTTFECDTITEVKSKVKFIRLDRAKYGRDWKGLKVTAINADVTRLFL
jgi:hypothetical protein